MASKGDLQTYLDELVERHAVLGAGLAVVAEGEIIEVASGLAHAGSRSAMTVDTLCLVGSTTKALTATLVMQLVDEGRLDLDDPVVNHLPDVRVPEEVTVRHLLSHSSGLDCGPYADCGRGDDAVKRYAENVGEDQFIAGPGERWGYSNAGYVIAGRLVEVLRGLDWDEALRFHLLQPAGLNHAETLTERVVLHPLAAPHVATKRGVSVAATWGVAGRSMGPTGSTLAASAGDLARFAKIHLDDGLAEGGRRILSANVVSEMQHLEVAVTPGSPFAEHWGLGWYGADWGGRQMRGHAGHNGGAGSHLALFPEVGGALALVFNTVPGDAGLYHEVAAQLAAELFGATKPAPWSPLTPLAPESLTALAGRYRCSQFEVDVQASGGGLEVAVTGANRLAMPRRLMSPALHGRAWGSGALGAHAAEAPPGHVTPEVFFSESEPGRPPRYLYLSVFPSRRVDTQEHQLR